MSYEKVAISESASALPTIAPITMREDRVVDPYERAARANKSPIGQSDINSGSSAPAEPGIPAESVTLSPQMAALARKEQKFRQEQQKLKADSEAIAKERAEIAELKALKAKLDAKDYSGIEGQVDYEAYTNYLIEKQSGSSPEQQALKALAEKVELVEKSQKDDVSKRFEAAVNERRKAVVSLVETNEEYSSIKEMKAQETVVQHILDTWEHDNIDLSPEQAAKEVEEILVEKANKWASLTKLKASGLQVDDKKSLPPLKPAIKTITNNMTAQGEIKRPVKSFHNMTDGERYAEARRRAEEKLSKGIR